MDFVLDAGFKFCSAYLAYFACCAYSAYLAYCVPGLPGNRAEQSAQHRFVEWNLGFWEFYVCSTIVVNLQTTRVIAVKSLLDFYEFARPPWHEPTT